MIFITIEQAVQFHAHVINHTGGSHGIRDIGLLISAIEMPKAMMFGEFLHPGVCDMAAAYLYHIVGNHPFIDGNKRTACVVMWTFLDVNGVDITYPNDFDDFVVGVAMGQYNKTDISEYLVSRTA